MSLDAFLAMLGTILGAALASGLATWRAAKPAPREMKDRVDSRDRIKEMLEAVARVESKTDEQTKDLAVLKDRLNKVEKKP